MKTCIICGKAYSQKGAWKTCSKECSEKRRKQMQKLRQRELYRENTKEYKRRNLRNRKKRLARIKTFLGSRCSVCGSLAKLVFHHLAYKDGATRQQQPSLKDAKNGTLKLVCRKHHRYIAIIAELKRNGEFEKTVMLVNEKFNPRYRR